MSLCWFYDEFMLIPWWIYVDCMMNLCWFYDESMLILWGYVALTIYYRNEVVECLSMQENAYVGQRCAIGLALREQPFYIQDLSTPCLATSNLLPADVLYGYLRSTEVACEEKASGWQMLCHSPLRWAISGRSVERWLSTQSTEKLSPSFTADSCVWSIVSPVSRYPFASWLELLSKPR